MTGARVAGGPRTGRSRRRRRSAGSVGALLDARAFHRGRSAYHRLLSVAMTGGYGRRRVRDVLNMVGLDGVAGKRPKGFSLGMVSGWASPPRLIGDPAVVMLDEPVNGLDLDGIRWIRGLLRGLAAEGRTVFVSSDLMSEVAMTADRLVMIGRGRLIADVPMEQMTSATSQVRVRTTEPGRLRELLAGGWTVANGPDGTLLASGGASRTSPAPLWPTTF